MRLGIEERREEQKSLYVVEVEVGEEDVDPLRQLTDGEPEVADAGAGVEDEQRVVGEPQRDARRVPSVAHGFRSRAGHRASRSPDRELHQLPGPSSQKIASAPRVPSVPVIGKAQTSIRWSLSVAERIRIRSCEGSSFESAIESGSSSTGKGDPSSSHGHEPGSPFLRLHRARLLIAQAEQLSGRVVEEDERALRVDQERRRRQVRDQPSGLDQLDRVGSTATRRTLDCDDSNTMERTRRPSSSSASSARGPATGSIRSPDSGRRTSSFTSRCSARSTAGGVQVGLQQGVRALARPDYRRPRLGRRSGLALRRLHFHTTFGGAQLQWPAVDRFRISGEVCPAPRLVLGPLAGDADDGQPPRGRPRMVRAGLFRAPHRRLADASAASSKPSRTSSEWADRLEVVAALLDEHRREAERPERVPGSPKAPAVT